MLIAFFFLCFKFFWFLVQGFTLKVLDYVLEGPMLLRLLVGLPLIALPVLVAGYLLFGDQDRPGWQRLFELRNTDGLPAGLHCSEALRPLSRVSRFSS